MYTMFNTSLDRVTELYDNLKEEYNRRINGTLPRSQSSQSRLSASSKSGEELGNCFEKLFGKQYFLEFDFGMYIKPKELVRFINSKKSVLIIDYRAVREVQLCYPDLDVAQVPVNVLAPG